MKKQLLLASVFTVGICGLGVIGNANAEMTDSKGGSESVDDYHGLKSSKTYDRGISLRSIQLGKISGGYWIRGTTSKYVKSKYKHYKGYGYASVINGNGVHKDGGWQSKGHWSNAVLKKTKHGNKAFYDHT
ncbi:lactococcin 972 family bacteriocin [Staphylococcus sp. Marseille-Q5304]|uniref:lactococcin 972 family bacteriocin n=1 Tax=Staphylococcus sp. Marseille-Q5304 TaxID=2942200 RepID=UPI002072CFC7|nr:lactococcin 972 family bacteriocin [Staphylococcus sp. Marseille-Q5304]